MKIVWTLAPALMCAALTGCGTGGPAAVTPAPAEPPAERTVPAGARVVTDDAQRKVSVPEKPRRIACAVSFTSEMLLALGVTPVLRNKVNAEDVFPKEAEAVPTFDVDHGSGPNLEQLAAATPDLVLISPVFGRFVQTIETRLKVPALVLKIQNYGQVAEKLRLLGGLTGTEARAEEVIAAMEAERKSLLAGLPEKKTRVLALFGTPQAFLGFQPDSYMGSLIAQMNGEPVVAGSEANKEFRSMYNFSLEMAVSLDPDVILIAHHGKPGEVSEALQNDPAWKNLRAVKEKRVHAVSERLYVTNPGPRATEALRELRGFFAQPAGASADAGR
ncbi:MAG: ABC transporter substrate-binding protein [Planctomycetota bacterium]|nr:ABC transporter substrate-binding protein [Planctomycetota bacterium]